MMQVNVQRVKNRIILQNEWAVLNEIAHFLKANEIQSIFGYEVKLQGDQL